jgi:hypothetical protein
MSQYDNIAPRSSRPFGLAAITEQRILQAIFVLKNPRPHQIKKYLDEHIPKRLTLRHIHRVLQKLSSEGILVHVDGKYSISKPDLRYVGGLFGKLALDCIFENSKQPAIKESLRKLITGFGVLVLYMFMEASRPTENDKPVDETNQETHTWLQKSVPLEDMFTHFFITYCEFTDFIKNPHEFTKDTIYKIEFTDLKNPHKLRKDTIRELTRTLEEQYPYEYKQIQKARNLLTSSISGNLREMKKDLPDFLTRTGEGKRWKEINQQLKKYVSDGGYWVNFIMKLAHTPEEYEEFVKGLERES